MDMSDADRAALTYIKFQELLIGQFANINEERVARDKLAKLQ